jgi:hypothetical protein
MGSDVLTAPAVVNGSDGLPANALIAFLTPDPAIRPRHRAFLPDPAQVAHARRFARIVVGQCAAADDTALLISEVVTNSLLHSNSAHGGLIHVIIAHHCPAMVRAAVIDKGSATGPTPARAENLDRSGRGLALVQAIASRWGHHGNDRSRAVWFEIACR